MTTEEKECFYCNKSFPLFMIYKEQPFGRYICSGCLMKAEETERKIKF